MELRATGMVAKAESTETNQDTVCLALYIEFVDLLKSIGSYENLSLNVVLSNLFDFIEHLELPCCLKGAVQIGRTNKPALPNFAPVGNRNSSITKLMQIK